MGLVARNSRRRQCPRHLERRVVAQGKTSDSSSVLPSIPAGLLGRSANHDGSQSGTLRARAEPGLLALLGAEADAERLRSATSPRVLGDWEKHSPPVSSMQRLSPFHTHLLWYSGVVQSVNMRGLPPSLEKSVVSFCPSYYVRSPDQTLTAVPVACLTRSGGMLELVRLTSEVEADAAVQAEQRQVVVTVLERLPNPRAKVAAAL